MSAVSCRTDHDQLTISLSGEVNSVNAKDIENQIGQIRKEHPCSSLVLDCEKLEYISSAGLRVILRLKQEIEDLKVINTTPEVYSVFEMTGFTQMMKIQKMYRTISLAGCEIIGRGANGKVYQLNHETVAKVFHENGLPEIHREQELSRTAFIAGIPTAIPFDVVRVREGGYATVYEMLDASSYANLLIRGEKTVEEIVQMSVDLLKLIHSKKIKPDTDLPPMKPIAQGWADDLKPYLEKDLYQKLRHLIDEVPDDPSILHGDFHIKNILYQDGESLLIDLDTICHGHPVFEWGSIYNTYVGFGEVYPESLQHFLEIPVEKAAEIWQKSLAAYLGTKDEQRLKETEKKAQVIGWTRLMRRKIRRGGMDTEEGRAEIQHYHNRLQKLVPQMKTLVF